MQGYFDVKTLGARGLKDEDFERAIKEGAIHSLLADLKLHQHARGRNMINDNFAGHVLQRLFQTGPCASYYNEENEGAPSASLAFIALETTDSDPTYTESWGYVGGSMSIYNVQDGAAESSYGSKRFEQDEIDPYELWVHTDGREAISFRNRVLWLPTQGVSNNIRSIGIYFNENGDSTGSYYAAIAKTGRIRLKDTNGKKVILTKNDREVLIVEYTFTYVAL
jgi:hypothetical protein